MAWTPRSTPQRRQRALAAGWCLLLIAAFACGLHLSADGFFHRYFDQVSYRYESAHVAEAFRQEGFVPGLATAWQHATAQGFVYPLIGGAAYAVGLDPAHALFAWFSVVLFSVWWITSSGGGRAWVGWLAVALTTATTTLLNKTGGPLDFRPDFYGQTMWTWAAALGLSSRGFERRGACVALGLVLGLAFCGRSLTLAYAAAGLPLCAACAWFGVPAGAPGRPRRLANLALAAAIASAVAAPFFLAHREVLWDYYIENHISERENAARGYRHDFTKYFRAYGRSLFRQHVGGVAALLALAAVAWTWHQRDRRAWPQWLLATAFLSPILVLTCGPQFSDTVAGVAAGATVLIALVPALSNPAAPRPHGRAFAVVLAAGLAVFPVRLLYKCARDHHKRAAAGHDLVATQHAAILDWTRGRTDVVVSTLPLIEAHSLAMLELVGFETENALPRRFAYGLGHSIYACADRGEFRARLEGSDVVLWWDGGASGGDLPSNREAAARRADIEEILARRFALAPAPAGEIELEGRPLRLYFATAR